MKRPFGYACLFFILFIRVFYMCFPPALPDYTELAGRRVYVNGLVISKEYKKIQNVTQTVYTLGDVQVMENSAADSSDYISDKTIYHNEKIYCYSTKEFKDTFIGSRVWVQGAFQGYEAPENPGQFDSQLYYYIQGTGGSLKEARLVWTDSRKDLLRQGLFDLRTSSLAKIENCFTGWYSGVMQTILLGDKSDLDKDLKSLFQEGGILHILTISGLHISMLGMNCFRLLRKAGTPLKVSAIAGMVVVLTYGAMIGTGAATFRAIVMFVMQMSAILLGRTYDRLTGLAVAAVLLLLEEPMYVFYSGFLLSFTAVLGVTIVTPTVEKLFSGNGKVTEWFGKLFGGGIGILLASFPVQLYFYYEYPLYSMLVNVLVLPLLPFIVGFGALVLMIPKAVIGLTLPFRLGAELVLWGYQWVCEQSRKLPLHNLVLGAPKAWQIVIYYTVLIITLWLLQKGYYPVKMKKRIVLRNVLAGIVMAAAIFVVVWRPTNGLECTFLSVGQGDCAIVRHGKETFVIDCGSTDRSNVGINILLPCLKYYGVSKVSGVFLSHADSDHVNGILQWLDHYEHSHVELGMLILPALSEKELTEEFHDLMERADRLDIPVAILGAGDHFALGKLEVEVLHPQKRTTNIEDSNGYSQVLLLRYGENRLLFTGDIGAEQEKKLTKALATILMDEQVTVLKVPHHGSKYSSWQGFLDETSPKHAILSYGVGNQYGHPHEDTVERLEAVGAHLWYTGRQGAIMVGIEEDEVTVEGFRGNGSDNRYGDR